MRPHAANSNNIRLHRLSDCTVFFDFDNTVTRFDVLDIAGGYSRPRTDGFLKTALSTLDRPRDYTARDKPPGLINAVNEETNIKILNLLTGRKQFSA